MVCVRLRVHRQERKGQVYTWYELTLPKDIVEALGWGEGTELEVKIVVYEGKQAIVLVPVE